MTKVSRDSAVGLVTRYGLKGPGIESLWGAIFRTRPDRPWSPPSLLYNGYRVTLPAVKQPGGGGGIDHPPPSMVKLQEKIWLSWPVL